MYAIQSEYMSGPLRTAFTDLLIALHLEFHAYARYVIYQALPNIFEKFLMKHMCSECFGLSLDTYILKI